MGIPKSPKTFAVAQGSGKCFPYGEEGIFRSMMVVDYGRSCGQYLEHSAAVAWNDY